MTEQNLFDADLELYEGFHVIPRQPIVRVPMSAKAYDPINPAGYYPHCGAFVRFKINGRESYTSSTERYGYTAAIEGMGLSGQSYPGVVFITADNDAPESFLPPRIEWWEETKPVTKQQHLLYISGGLIDRLSMVDVAVLKPGQKFAYVGQRAAPIFETLTAPEVKHLEHDEITYNFTAKSLNPLLKDMVFSFHASNIACANRIKLIDNKV